MIPAVFRLFCFAAFQLLIGSVFFMLDNPNPWRTAEGFWLVSGSVTNVVCFLILLNHKRKEAAAGFYIFRPDRLTLRRDLLLSLGILLCAAPISTFPNIFLAGILFPSPDIATEMLFRPIPYWVRLCGIFWALTQGLVELPFYFIYSRQRLKMIRITGPADWLIPIFLLALQHAALPLIPDLRFALWRFGMFLPLALLFGVIIKLKPRLLPYLMIIHALLDIGALFMVLQVN